MYLSATDELIIGTRQPHKINSLFVKLQVSCIIKSSLIIEKINHRWSIIDQLVDQIHMVPESYYFRLPSEHVLVRCSRSVDRQ
jgi:hypothetical protein